MKYNTLELPNGVRVVHLPVNWSGVAHVGLVINVGSRDEKPRKMGMAHFIEHMLFRGTEKRKTYHILNYLEAVGGDLNAYTTKEKTCLYASLPNNYFERAVELLSDIAFHSIFPEKEIEKEKLVVLDEIGIYRDNPEEAVFEDFDRMVFPDHPLGNPILGHTKTVKSINRDDLDRFIRSNYAGDNVVLSITGDLDFDNITRIAEKYLSHINSKSRNQNRKNGFPEMNQQHSIETPGARVHKIMGGRSYPLRKGNYFTFSLLNNYLGGNANNTLLNLKIREKYGLSYNLYSFSQAYSDSGLWGIYFSSEPDTQKRITELIWKELRKLKTQKLGSMKLSQIKKQIIGQLILGRENLLSRMLSQAKDVLDFGHPVPLEEILRKIDEIDASMIMEVANERFNEQEITTLTYLPQGNGK